MRINHIQHRCNLIAKCNKTIMNKIVRKVYVTFTKDSCTHNFVQKTQVKVDVEVWKRIVEWKRFSHYLCMDICQTHNCVNILGKCK